MQRLKIIALALCIFASGILTGAFGMRLYVQRAARDFMAGNTAFAQKMVLSRLDDALDLTSDQEERIRPIVEETAGKLSELRRRFIPQADVIINEAAGKMAEELTPGQREKLEKMLASIKNLRGSMDRNQ